MSKDFEIPLPGTILKKLQRTKTSYKEACELVVWAEFLKFDVHQQSQLRSLLLKFIQESHQQNESSDSIAVGSAIRKYISLLAPEEMDSTMNLFGAPAFTYLEEIIEIVKMLYRKFEDHPKAEQNLCPTLAKKLYGLADWHSYSSSSPGTIITMLAMLSLIAMRNKEIMTLFEYLERTASHFKARLLQRLIGLRCKWKEYPESVKDLDVFISELQAAIEKERKNEDADS